MAKGDEEYDFGFSFSEDSTEQTAASTKLIEEKYKAKLKEVEDLILPLLQNLKKNPDKPMINWPNRTPVIDKQIAKITAITRG